MSRKSLGKKMLLGLEKFQMDFAGYVIVRTQNVLHLSN
jgi:hypothetical protein